MVRLFELWVCFEAYIFVDDLNVLFLVGLWCGLGKQLIKYHGWNLMRFQVVNYEILVSAKACDITLFDAIMYFYIGWRVAIFKALLGKFLFYKSCLLPLLLPLQINFLHV